VRGARLRAGDGASVAVPLVPGVLAGRLARQGVHARADRDPSRAHRALEAGSLGLRPPATRRRLPPESPGPSVNGGSPDGAGSYKDAGRRRGSLRWERAPSPSPVIGPNSFPHFGLARTRLSTSPCSSASVRVPLTARVGKVPSGVSSR